MMGLLYSEGNIPLPEGNIPFGPLLGFCRDARSLRVFFNSGALYGSKLLQFAPDDPDSEPEAPLAPDDPDSEPLAPCTGRPRRASDRVDRLRGALDRGALDREVRRVVRTMLKRVDGFCCLFGMILAFLISFSFVQRQEFLFVFGSFFYAHGLELDEFQLTY
jgi:hypothetical protein